MYLTDKELVRIQTALASRLSTTTDDAFVDRDHCFPQRVWLNVDLGNGGGGNTNAIESTLHALGEWCATVSVEDEDNTCDLEDSMYLWASFLSASHDELQYSSHHIEHQTQRTSMAFDIDRFAFHRGLHIKLQWMDEPLTVHVAEALRNFMGTPAVQEVNQCLEGSNVVVRPITIALVLTNVGLDREAISRIGSILAAVPPPSSEPSLFPLDRIQLLDVSDNTLGHHELEALAVVIASSPRRIDELVIENVIPEDASTSESPAYLAAFERLLMAAFQPHQTAHQAHAFSLSIGRNASLRVSHITILWSVLRGATRPLRKLAVTDLPFQEDTWKAIGRLLCAWDYPVSPDLELDISGNDNLEGIACALKFGLETAAIEDEKDMVGCRVSSLNMSSIKGEITPTIFELMGERLRRLACRDTTIESQHYERIMSLCPEKRLRYLQMQGSDIAPMQTWFVKHSERGLEVVRNILLENTCIERLTIDDDILVYSMEETNPHALGCRMKTPTRIVRRGRLYRKRLKSTW